MFRRNLLKKLCGYANIGYLLRLEYLKLELLHVRRPKQDILWYYNILRGNVALDCSKFCTYPATNVLEDAHIRFINNHHEAKCFAVQFCRQNDFGAYQQTWLVSLDASAALFERKLDSVGFTPYTGQISQLTCVFVVL